jgi:hypothetical protein
MVKSNVHKLDKISMPVLKLFFKVFKQRTWSLSKIAAKVAVIVGYFELFPIMLRLHMNC